MEHIAYYLVLAISVLTLIAAIVEIILLCRILANQKHQNDQNKEVIKDLAGALRELSSTQTKVSDSLIRTEERIDRYQENTNNKLDMIRNMKN